MKDIRKRIRIDGVGRGRPGPPIATGLGYTRNSLVILNAAAVIAIDGEYGTLSEIAYGLIHGKRVVGLGTWDIRGVTVAATPEEAGRLAPAGPAARDDDR